MSFVTLIALFLWGNTTIEPLIEVRGDGEVITNGDESFSLTNYTDFGSVLNTVDDVNEQTITREFVIHNTGSSTLNISDLSLEDFGGFFEIASTPASSVAPGGNTSFEILFNSHAFGSGFAKVTIESSAGEYTFYVRGRNIECNPLTCFGLTVDSEDVCNGEGSCIGQDTCECNGLNGGTECQIPYRWNDGGLAVEIPGLQTTPRLFIGSTLSDPNVTYSITIRIEVMNIFAGQLTHIGLIQLPPSNLVHHLGTQPNEYGYRANGNKVDNSTGSGGVAYGTSYSAGDYVQINYNAQTKELSFAVREGSDGEFEDQGVAYTNIPQEGEEIAFALSTTSFVGGGVRYVIVDPDE